MSKCSNSNVPLDSLSKKAHIEQQIMRDTIVKYDTIKMKADVVYRTKHDTLWKLPPSDVDSIFNVTFPRDTLDSTSYSTGYTQLRKAVDAHNKSERDSTKVEATVEQVKACTTTVTNLVKQIDTVKIDTKPDYKTIGLTGVLLLFIGFVGGVFAN